MEIHRSLGVARLVAFLAEHRGRTAHERLLGRLDRSMAEARELCERAEEMYPEDRDRAIANAFRAGAAHAGLDASRRGGGQNGETKWRHDMRCAGERAAPAHRHRQRRDDAAS